MIMGSLSFSTFLWPATTKVSSSAATSSRLAIHCARSAEIGRTDGSASSAFSRQVKECLGLLADPLDEPGDEVADRGSILALNVLVGGISLARAVDDPELSETILTKAAEALNELKRR
jgi:hypothetical protein